MADHQVFFQTFKDTLSLADIDPDIEFTNYVSGRYTNDEEAYVFNFHNSINSILPQNWENLHGLFVHDDSAVLTPPQSIISKEGEMKRKAMEMTINTPENSSANTCSYSSPQVSDSGSRKTKRGGRGKKAMKGEIKKDEKPREVIHVRAKRGQATDSHSLAERVRRGKINERLKCLQDIVPGCYKTMGMAVMLDEIINYVQSLQNQVDFLSMKLTAASLYYDFNTDIDAIEAMQRGNAFEAVKAESLANVEVPSAQFSQLAQNFGYCMQLPYRR